MDDSLGKLDTYSLTEDAEGEALRDLLRFMRISATNPSEEDIKTMTWVLCGNKKRPSKINTSMDMFLSYPQTILDLVRAALVAEDCRPLSQLEFFYPIQQHSTDKWLTISLVRHGESQENLSQSGRDPDSALSARGLYQIAQLGVDWKDVRIDALYSSPMKRAVDTAKAISSSNVGHPHIYQRDGLVERGGLKFELKKGHTQRDGRSVEGHESLAGMEYDEERHGESYQTRSSRFADLETLADITARVTQELLLFIRCHGVQLPSPPQMYLDKSRSDDPDCVPDNIPHIVLVAHNNPICELYEVLMSWNQGKHRTTRAEIGNTEWSRHILCLRGSDRNVQGRGKLYGRMENHIVCPLRGTLEEVTTEDGTPIIFGQIEEATT